MPVLCYCRTGSNFFPHCSGSKPFFVPDSGKNASQPCFRPGPRSKTIFPTACVTRPHITSGHCPTGNQDGRVAAARGELGFSAAKSPGLVLRLLLHLPFLCGEIGGRNRSRGASETRRGALGHGEGARIQALRWVLLPQLRPPLLCSRSHPSLTPPPPPVFRVSGSRSS